MKSSEKKFLQNISKLVLDLSFPFNKDFNWNEFNESIKFFNH